MNNQPKNKGNALSIAVTVIVLIYLLSMCSSGGGGGRKTCAWCNGTGYSGNGAKNAVEYVMNKTPCKHCNGTGHIG